VSPGGPQFSPFQAGAPGAGLGADAPSISPAAIQQMLALKRAQEAMRAPGGPAGLPGAGVPTAGEPPQPSNPITQQLAARRALPTRGGGRGRAVTQKAGRRGAVAAPAMLNGAALNNLPTPPDVTQTAPGGPGAMPGAAPSSPMGGPMPSNFNPAL